MDVKDILARVQAKKQRKRLKPEDKLPYWERQDGRDQGTPEAAEQRKQGNAGTTLDALLAAGYLTPEQHGCGARLHFLFRVRFAAVWERDPKQRDDQEQLEELYREAVRTMGKEGTRHALNAAVFDRAAPCREALQALAKLWTYKPHRKERASYSWRAEGAVPVHTGRTDRVIYVQEYKWQRKRRRKA